MRSRIASLAAGIACFSILAFVACGGSSSDESGAPPSESGGSTGTSGAAGASAGTHAGGKSGSAGTSGKGGASGSAGVGGKSGSAGVGGKSGSGGSSGKGGSAGTGGKGGSGGSGGAGGACKPGFSDCDANPANGCEVATGTDPAHCGSCTAAPCASGPNAAAACTNGKCTLACTGGFLDCDGNAATGCEVDGTTDPKNCGACGMDCAGSSCVAGGCGCSGVSVTAQLLPLDMYVMMDQSGSMAETTANGSTKWDDVKTALSGFVSDPSSSGLGVGIGFFPANATNIGQCDPNADTCGVHGPCATQNACSQPAPGNKILLCNTTSQCDPANGGPGGTCVPIGTCANNAMAACFNVGSKCAMNLGTCNQLYTCQNEQCAVSDYATPEVPIATLPGVATSITTAMNAHSPNGGTPTAAALQGAIQYATSWESMHSDHVTVVVLATDGLPSQCTPQDIPGVSAIAAAGYGETPPIRTFVIGVFADADIAAGAPMNLDQIASAGGTSKATIVNTSQDVTMQFLTALNAIRTQAVACSYQIPPPQSGMTIDYGKVNVQVTPGGGSPVLLPNVSDPSMCPSTGGWYYDNPAAPTKIVLCASSCSSISMDAGAKVDVVLGCATVKP